MRRRIRWDIDSCSRLRDGAVSGDTAAVTSLCVGLSLAHRDYHTGDHSPAQPRPTFLLYVCRRCSVAVACCWPLCRDLLLALRARAPMLISGSAR
jgi:hypothetical protein